MRWRSVLEWPGGGRGETTATNQAPFFFPWLSRRCGRIRCSRRGIRTDTIGSHSHILPHLPPPTPILVLLPERVLEKLPPTPQRKKQATMIGRGRGDIILSSSFECHRRLPPPLPKPPQRPLLSSPPSPMKRGIHGSKGPFASFSSFRPRGPTLKHTSYLGIVVAPLSGGGGMAGHNCLSIYRCIYLARQSDRSKVAPKGDTL